MHKKVLFSGTLFDMNNRISFETHITNPFTTPTTTSSWTFNNIMVWWYMRCGQWSSRHRFQSIETASSWRAARFWTFMKRSTPCKMHCTFFFTKSFFFQNFTLYKSDETFQAVWKHFWRKFCSTFFGACWVSTSKGTSS